MSLYAQRAEVGVSGGAAGYIGDLNPDKLFKVSGMSAGMYAKINFDPHWGLGLHYHYGKVKANDATSSDPLFRDRNLNFKSPLNEMAVIGSFNFFDMYSPGSKRRITPFIFAGIGGVIFSPKGVYNGNEYVLRNFETEGQSSPYRSYAMVIPYGVGARFKINEYLTLNSEWGYRTAFTDYIDDVKGVYPDPQNSWVNGINPAISEQLSDPSVLHSPTGRMFKPGDQRGDFRKRDTYFFVNIGISYTFVSQKCFTF